MTGRQGKYLIPTISGQELHVNGHLVLFTDHDTALNTMRGWGHNSYFFERYQTWYQVRKKFKNYTNKNNDLKVVKNPIASFNNQVLLQYRKIIKDRTITPQKQRKAS